MLGILTGTSRLAVAVAAFRRSHSVVPFSRFDQDP